MNWKAKITHYKVTSRIAIYFEKNSDTIARIKTIEGARWSV
jgi:integrase/recombinase XerD